MLVALGLLVGACAAPAAPPATRSEERPAALAPRVGTVVPEPPESITLPGGATMAVRVVTTTSNGVLDVPNDVGVAGWWGGGSRIGDPFGSTLVAAHVDSATQGLGPFATLLRVRAGDHVQLQSAHLQQIFEVRSLRLVAPDTFAKRTGLRSARGPRRLTLVTCAPPYDAESGAYQNLAVVVATPVSVPTRRGRS